MRLTKSAATNSLLKNSHDELKLANKISRSIGGNYSNRISSSKSEKWFWSFDCDPKTS